MAISKIKSKSVVDDLELQGGATTLSSETQEDPPKAGQIRYNSNLRRQEIYDGIRWDIVNPQSVQVALSIALSG